MLMPMRRLLFAFVVLVAAATTLEPLIHTHPLAPTSKAPCAVCVGSVGRITTIHLTPAAPDSPVTTLASLPHPAIVQRAGMPLASRAPPAA